MLDLVETGRRLRVRDWLYSHYSVEEDRNEVRSSSLSSTGRTLTNEGIFILRYLHSRWPPLSPDSPNDTYYRDSSSDHHRLQFTAIIKSE